MIGRIFKLAICVLLSTNSFAQDSTKVAETTTAKVPYPIIRYRTTVLSSPYRMVRDEGHTPLIHRAPTAQVAVYNERHRAKSITKMEFLVGLGFLQTNKNKVNLQTRAPMLLLEVNYHQLRPVRKIFNEKGIWYLGGIFTNTLDNRLYSFLPNNSYGYEFSSVLNPATHLAYDFKFGKNDRSYQIGFKANLALIAAVIRPNYIGLGPSETYLTDKPNVAAIFGDTKLALPNRFFRINTELYLDRVNIVNKNKIRLFYAWGLHITKLPDSNNLYAAYHSIGLATMFYKEKAKKINPAKK